MSLKGENRKKRKKMVPQKSERESKKGQSDGRSEQAKKEVVEKDGPLLTCKKRAARLKHEVIGKFGSRSGKDYRSFVESWRLFQ